MNHHEALIGALIDANGFHEAKAGRSAVTRAFIINMLRVQTLWTVVSV